MTEALTTLFEAYDVDGFGELSHDQLVEVRDFLAPLALGGEAHVATAPSGPRGPCYRTAFARWALSYLGAFDCPSDAHLAVQIMAQAHSKEPPFTQRLPSVEPLADGVDATAEDLDALSEVLGQQLYLTSARTAADLDRLKAEEISHVLSVGAEFRGCQAHAGIRSMCADIDDADDQSEPPHIRASLEDAVGFISEAVQQKHRVVVHCRSGVSCGATVVLAYLIAQKGVTLLDGFKGLRQVRPVIWPGIGCMKALIALEAKHRKGKTTLSARRYALWSRPRASSGTQLPAPQQ